MVCAKNLGVGRTALSAWTKNARENNGEVPTRGSGDFESEEAKENARLRKELRDTQDALEILKKAIGILGNWHSTSAVIWTTEENQAENPCIVLAPQYESSNSSDPTYTMELLQSVIEQYGVDSNRLYLVGQSSGTIRSIKLLIDNPDTFAGALLVAGQADSDYEDLLSQLADGNIWMICSAGDERAYPGMTAIVETVESEGTAVTTSQWSADLSEDEQNSLAQEMVSAGTSINFTVFDAGTVMEDDVPVSAVTEHMNTWRVAYNIDTIRNWLLQQKNE